VDRRRGGAAVWEARSRDDLKVAVLNPLSSSAGRILRQPLRFRLFFSSSARFLPALGPAVAWRFLPARSLMHFEVCLIVIVASAILPSADLGPVLLRAFCRLASSYFRVVIA